ncbi:DNA polymerase IV [Stygiolobus caldivivus]|uniref:DNA polymerase IV n=1 Tax=Stygiolobus caldivivus TaxID=2824673 RepID=A0A8D5ZIR7_9CREN|nr:DNA polymerase IV [Stygiolobus caldivivus]BCU69512.1 DNA polymerase IV [Stygiolobus caldivivus]
MIILFIDFDYFFAQVEEVLNPQYKGKPLVVCVYSGRTKTSGAVATANYEARKLGVKAGMPIIKAMELAPSAVFVPMRKEIYQEVSNRVMEGILRKYSTKLEIASIDEAYLDITDKVKDYEEAYTLGRTIKGEIFEKEKITVTIGIAPNKVLAKIIADKNKPNGLSVLRPEDVPSFLNDLKIDEVPGVGKVLAEKLASIGVYKLTDVLKVDFKALEKEVGKAKATYLLKLAQNKYDEPVEDKSRKPHSRILTLPYNTRKQEVILPYLKRALDEAYSKVGGIPMRIALIAVMEDLDIVTKGKKFKHGVSKGTAYEKVKELLEEILNEDNRKIRRIGVRLDDIVKTKGLDQYF